MPETFAIVAESFAAEGAGTAAIVEADSVYAGSAVSAGGTGVAAGGGAAAAGSGGLGAVGTAVASAGASSLVGQLLAPKAPGLPAPVSMPDPLAQEAARKKSLIEQLARRGRAASILTDSPGGKLGG